MRSAGAIRWAAMIAAMSLACTTTLSCSRSERSGAAGSQAFPVASGELPAASVEPPRQLATPWSVSAAPSAEPAPATSVGEAGAGAAEADTGLADDKGPVRFGSLTVSGSLSQEVILKTIRARMPELRQCYDKKGGRQKGQLKVRLVIDREGTVITSVNGGSDLQNDPLIDCVLRAFWTMKFPRPKDGIVLVVLPLKLGAP